MARDYYAEARAIGEELRAAGRGDIADDLLEAIEGGSTATEILMALRWNLEKTLVEEIDLRGTAAKIRRLRDELDRVLR